MAGVPRVRVKERICAYRGEIVSFIVGSITIASSTLVLLWLFGYTPFKWDGEVNLPYMLLVPPDGVLLEVQHSCPSDLKTIAGLRFTDLHADESILAVTFEGKDKAGYSYEAFISDLDKCEITFEVSTTPPSYAKLLNYTKRANASEDNEAGAGLYGHTRESGVRGDAGAGVSEILVESVELRGGELEKYVTENSQEFETFEFIFILKPPLGRLNDFSSRSVNFGVIKGNTSPLELFLDLPDRFETSTVTPEPTSSAVIGDRKRFIFSRLIPEWNADIGFNSGFFRLKANIVDPERRKLGDVLTILMAAFVGIGSAGIFEAVISVLSRPLSDRLLR